MKNAPVLLRYLDTLLVSLRFRTPYFKGKDRLYRFLRRLMRNRPLTIRYGASGWITVSEAHYVERMIIQHGSYEQEVWDALAFIARDNEVVWDVGANVGSFTLNALRDKRVCEVHAFEPIPDTADILAHNIALNPRVSHKGHIHRLALGDTENTIRIYLGSNRAIHSAARDSGLGHIDVKCTTIDALVEHDGFPRPTLLKIDAEDFDKQVLLGADRLLREHPPKAIAFEIETNQVGNPIDEELVLYLMARGYTLHHIARPDMKIFFTSVTNNFIENYVAIHSSLGLGRLVL